MNILLTSIGRRTYMADWFRNALNGRGRLHAINSIPTLAFMHADAYSLAPEICSPDYIPFLLEYCCDNSIDAVIPLLDIDLPVLAKAAPLFEKTGTRVIVATPDTVEICRDKWQSSAKLQEWGISTPATFLSPKTALCAMTNNVSLNFPMIVKPRRGMGSIGFYKAFTPDELNLFFSHVVHEIDSSWLSRETRIDTESVIVQQMIIGCEYGMEIFNDLQGNIAAVSVKKKFAMRAGETDDAITVDSTPFMNLAHTLSERLRHPGNLDVDCIISPNNEIFVIDMNVRFGGQYPFSHCAGADFPRQIVEWLLGGGNNSNYLTIRAGVRSCKDILPVVCKI